MMGQFQVELFLLVLVGFWGLVKPDLPSGLNPFPPAVALFGPRDKFICNGVIIERGRVLVTADCLWFIANEQEVLGTPEDFHLVMETHSIDLYEKGKALPYDGKLNHYVKVEGITVHPNSSGPFANDIAILDVSKNRPNDKNAIAELPSDEDLTSSFNEVVQIYGWGTLSYGPADDDKEEYNKIRSVEMYLLPPESCSMLSNIFLPDQHLCLKPKNNATICVGFSGAPIVLDGKLIGVVGFGDESCSPSSPVIGTRLGAFEDFLKPKGWFGRFVERVKSAFESVVDFFSFF